jgi:sulfhydrogenase subunit alpha
MKSQKAGIGKRKKPTAKKDIPRKSPKTKTIKVANLARVEGEGGLYVKIRGKEIVDLKFDIFEPPRFFEAFLRGRNYSEVPDITARICGICPIAYQMSSAQAMERAFGAVIPDEIHQLRRLIYCGEWIESHVLHVFMLHAPDFLGYEDSIRMAKDHGDLVKMALKMKRIGNDLVELIGGREIHPVNLRVGGFYSVPPKGKLQAMTDDLKWTRDMALKAVEFVGTLEYPDFERDYEFVALHHPDTYAILEGRLVSNKGLDIDIGEYEDHFVELHVKHSNALHSVHRERGAYHVGPLARVMVNYGQLTPAASEAARHAGLNADCKNPFKSIIARSVEIVYACEEALRIIGEYEEPERPYIDLKPAAGTGYGCTEAPRGILFHKYRIDEKGLVLNSKLVPPTSQNQKTIEEDLWEYITPRLNLPLDKLTWQCEQAIRNYDPCISCATHFLDLKIERS